MAGPAGDRRGGVSADPLSLERIAAMLAFLLTLPLWIPVACIVVASVGRPILFRQTRSGLGGVPFTLCKFRTMTNERGADGQLLPDRLRETAATRLLRRLRLDELPQLLAVALGDMSFFGPRPLLPETVEGFGERGRLRGLVRPGLTGWAQVSGNTRLSDAQKLSLDLWYIRHRSLALNARILMRTALVLLRGEHPDAGALRLAAAEDDAARDAPASLAGPEASCR
ncbi:sugar transferase [Aureimonas sp. AU12]|uniref:sugar transferase n=1 Tax=Aureimonas sp. AU12 TaxID=1638161 RepID=UPI0009EB64BF|nr:sugar transferase [Aureimonas sp. AU12]